MECIKSMSALEVFLHCVCHSNLYKKKNRWKSDVGASRKGRKLGTSPRPDRFWKIDNVDSYREIHGLEFDVLIHAVQI